jgi:predicted O-methyltransferase YrrM
MNWTGGYVADIGYIAGFYRETAPSHMALIALMLGKSPGQALQPARYLELGFGQGLGLTLLAAANPDTQLEGIDFNPEHVANAERLIAGAELENVSVAEMSFEELAAKGGANDLDVIALHGIFTWVSPRAQDAIVQIIRQRLKPNGFVYISYNCMPGWAPLAPIRQFMVEVKRQNPGHSSRQIEQALRLVTRLKDGKAAYFLANPAAAQHVEAMANMDRVYLAHEYLDEHWQLLQFSEMADRLSEAKLAFVGSASLPENLDAYTIPADLQPLLGEIENFRLREAMRDLCLNRRFRRDIFSRGTASITKAEHRRLLSKLKFSLAVSRENVVFKFAGPLQQLQGREDLYNPIADLLASHIASFDELVALEPFGEAKLNILLECLGLLVHSGQAVALMPPETDPAPAKRFNRLMVENARAGRLYGNLASPFARTGLPASDLGLFTLSSILDGEDEIGKIASRALGAIKGMGRVVMKDGEAVHDETAATDVLVERMSPILEKQVPVWRRLGVF